MSTLGTREARRRARSSRARSSAPLQVALAVLLLSSPAMAAGLLESNHPLVERGNEAFAKGDYEGALAAYEEAEKELPRSPELHYNRGNALLKLGRADDARKSYERALTGAGDGLKARDYYNLGNAFSELGKEKEAISAWRQSLKVDPKFEPARHNLELTLLRKQQQPPDQNKDGQGDGGTPDGGQPDAGPTDGGQPDAGSDGGTDGGTDGGEDGGGQGSEDGGEDGGRADGGSDEGDGGTDGGADGGDSSGADGGQPQQDGGTQSDGGEQRDGGQQQNEQDESRDGGSGEDGGMPDAGPSSSADPQEQEPPKDVDRQRAEQLLDAIRRNEKQFLMHQQPQKKGKIRVPERDW